MLSVLLSGAQLSYPLSKSEAIMVYFCVIKSPSLSNLALMDVSFLLADE